VGVIVLQTLSPLPEEPLRGLLAGARRIVVPELNPGLLAPEIERLAPHCRVASLSRIDGGLIAPESIAAAAEAA
jgi:pyruvate/2-oxoacid:ferredoxin oxidoreductase alpha subunit